MKFEFTTASCLRPELLDITYRTLNENLQDVDLKKEGVLYINIDPIPEDNAEISEILSIANKYFSQVEFRIGEKGGNFPDAMRWLFSRPHGDYFFNIEEDWETLLPICINKIIEEINNFPKKEDLLQYVLFCDKRFPGLNTAYFTPSVFKTCKIKSILQQFPFEQNFDPEEWIRNIKKSKKIHYEVLHAPKRHFEDIGRPWMKTWMKKNSLKKRESFLSRSPATLANGQYEKIS